MSDFHDMEFIGEKIAEMIDRVKVVHAAMPGSQAKWVIEEDGVRYNVVVSVDDPALKLPKPESKIIINNDAGVHVDAVEEVDDFGNRKVVVTLSKLDNRTAERVRR